MPLLGGADEIGVGNVEPYPEFLEPLMKFVDMFLRAHTNVIGGLLDFLPMLISARQEKDFNPFKTFVAGNHIRRDGGVGGRRYCGGRLGFGEGRPQLGDVLTLRLSHPGHQRGIRKDKMVEALADAHRVDPVTEFVNVHFFL